MEKSNNRSWLDIKTVPDDNKVMVLRKRRLSQGQTLSVLQADITDVEVDAITSHCYLSGQVGRAILRKGGDELKNIIKKYRENRSDNLKKCQAVILDASKNLLCQKIIQVNSPNWRDTHNMNLLTESVENILLIAEEHMLESVALPNLSSGMNGFPKRIAAQTILEAVHSHFKSLENNPKSHKSSITEVLFVLYDGESVNVYINELDKLNI